MYIFLSVNRNGNTDAGMIWGMLFQNLCFILNITEKLVRTVVEISAKSTRNKTKNRPAAPLKLLITVTIVTDFFSFFLTFFFLPDPSYIDPCIVVVHYK